MARGKSRIDRIVIYCTPETKKAWRMYASQFRNYEEALRAILEEKGYLQPKPKWGRVY
jgi:predicted deacylase